MIERQPDIDRCADHYQQLSAAQHTARVEHKYHQMHEKWEQIMTQLRLYGERCGCYSALYNSLCHLRGGNVP